MRGRRTAGRRLQSLEAIGERVEALEQRLVVEVRHPAEHLGVAHLGVELRRVEQAPRRLLWHQALLRPLHLALLGGD
jgi:hypothetical protein